MQYDRQVDLVNSHPKAIEKYNKGEKLHWSTNIAEELNCGYGELDWYGFWEFPLFFIQGEVK